jgi:hypothetical protein
MITTKRLATNLLASLSLSILLWSFNSSTQASDQDRQLAKYEPPQGKVLVFVGQDNKSVGGTDKWSDGYVDHIGMPAGVTHYVYFTEGQTNNFDFTFDKGHVDGLLTETTWGAGPMWSGWGDSRIETNAKLKQKWMETMQQESYIHQTEGTYELIGFDKR